MNVCPGIRIKCIFWGGKKNEVISELTRITPVNHFQWGTCSLHLETVFAEDWQRASSHGAATINWNSSARAAAAKKLRILKRAGGVRHMDSRRVSKISFSNSFNQMWSMVATSPSVPEYGVDEWPEKFFCGRLWCQWSWCEVVLDFVSSD